MIETIMILTFIIAICISGDGLVILTEHIRKCFRKQYQPRYIHIEELPSIPDGIVFSSDCIGSVTKYQHILRFNKTTLDGFILPFNGDEKHASIERIAMWTNEHLGQHGDVWDNEDYMFGFVNKEDAMAFKLRWT